MSTYESALPQQSMRLAIGQDKTVGFTLEIAPSASAAGWAMAFYVRTHAGALLVTKTSGSGITATDGALGKWDVVIQDTDTDALTPQQAKGSFWRTDDQGETPLAVFDVDIFRTSRTG